MVLAPAPGLPRAASIGPRCLAPTLPRRASAGFPHDPRCGRGARRARGPGRTSVRVEPVRRRRGGLRGPPRGRGHHRSRRPDRGRRLLLPPAGQLPGQGPLVRRPLRVAHVRPPDPRQRPPPAVDRLAGAVVGGGRLELPGAQDHGLPRGRAPGGGPRPPRPGAGGSPRRAHRRGAGRHLPAVLDHRRAAHARGALRRDGGVRAAAGLPLASHPDPGLGGGARSDARRVEPHPRRGHRPGAAAGAPPHPAAADDPGARTPEAARGVRSHLRAAAVAVGGAQRARLPPLRAGLDERRRALRLRQQPHRVRHRHPAHRLHQPLRHRAAPAGPAHRSQQRELPRVLVVQLGGVPPLHARRATRRRVRQGALLAPPGPRVRRASTRAASPS